MGLPSGLGPLLGDLTCLIMQGGREAGTSPVPTSLPAQCPPACELSCWNTNQVGGLFIYLFFTNSADTHAEGGPVY